MNQENQTNTIPNIFTEVDNGVNIDANNLNINCLTSKNNKFNLDQDGNLTVNNLIVNNSFTSPTNDDYFSEDIYGADLNTMEKNGFYYGSNLVNAPENNKWGFLLIINHSSYLNNCTQLYFPSGENYNFFFFRKQYEKTWGPWFKVYGTAI